MLLVADKRPREKCLSLPKASAKEVAISWITKARDPPWLMVKMVDDQIGMGLFASKNLSAGDFIVEYAGELLAEKIGSTKEDQTYIFYFQNGRKKWCIDASSSKRKGRYINDEWQSPNAFVEKLECRNKPRLAVFAKRRIEAGEEIRYNYGIMDAPWRQNVTDKQEKDSEDFTAKKSDMKEHTQPVGEHLDSEYISEMHENEPLPCEDHHDTDSESDMIEYKPDVEESKEKSADTEDVPEMHDDRNVSSTEDHQQHIDVQATNNQGHESKVTDKQEKDSEDFTAKKSDMKEHTQPVGEHLDSEYISEMHENEPLPSEDHHDADSESDTIEYKPDVEESKEKSADTEDVPEMHDDRNVSSTEDHQQHIDVQATNNQGHRSKVTDKQEKDSEDFTAKKSDMKEHTQPVGEHLDSEYISEMHENEPLPSEDHHDTDSESDTIEYKPDGEESWDESSDMEDAPEMHDYKNVSSTEDHPQHIDVQATNNKGRRVFDKKFPCYFCSEFQSQIQRHLREQHSQESEVQAIINEKNKQEKDKHMTLLRNRGTHRHNCQVLREGRGTLIVVYRPTLDASPADYGPCDICLGYYVRTDLWKHKCKLGTKTKGHSRNTSKPAVSCKLLLPNPKGISAGLHQITRVMANDQISLIAKNDPLIVNLGQRHFLSHGHDPDMHATIRTKMRESARLLQELRNLTKNPNARMEEFLNPVHFRTVVAAVQKVTGYDELTHNYRVPSLALKYGHSLKKMAAIVTGIASELGDDVKYTQSKQFIERCNADWAVFVSSNALRTLDMKKMNNKKMIPLTEDVAALTNTLKERGRQCVQVLLQYSEEVTENQVEAWRELNELTLTLLMLFNRRRQGEISKMKISEVDKISYMQKDSNVVNALSPLEKHLCEVLSRVEIVGKRGRLVPVLLNFEMREWITLLMDKRHDVAGVDPENEYVFARSFYGSKGHIRGCDTLRKYSQLCGAKYPESLTGTQLRKQIATLCQLFSLTENEMDMVANFLGHDVKIHREYYRLPMEVMQVAKVSKLLLAMEKGGSSLSQAKNLDDLYLSDNELEESSPTEGDEEVAMDNSSQKATKRRKAKDSDHAATNLGKSKRRKTSTKRRPWSESEKAAVRRHLHPVMVLNKLPGRKAIEQCQKQEPVLANRTWTNIKDYCRNAMKHLLED